MNISLPAQPFDLDFHPLYSSVYTCLLSGELKAFDYTHHGLYEPAFTIKLSERSLRGLTVRHDGSEVIVVGKSKAIYVVDTSTSTLKEKLITTHNAAINRVKSSNTFLFVTGDDDGVVNLWDSRQNKTVKSYVHHTDYITDLLWLDDNRQLIVTSGDNTLSVLDVRSNKTKPSAQSEDQEDELLCIAAINGAAKFVTGTQSGVLHIFNRKNGWGDCIDRIPGHPQSVDTMCTLPDTLPNCDASSSVLTGSSDGLVRLVDLYPTNLKGIISDHGEWPIERIAIGTGECRTKQSSSAPSQGSEKEDDKDRGRWWLGSIGHDQNLKLTPLLDFFDDNSEGEGEDVDEGADGDDSEGESSDTPSSVIEDKPPTKQKRKRKETTGSNKKAHVAADNSFFDAL